MLAAFQRMPLDTIGPCSVQNTGRPWGRPWDVAGNFWDFRFKLLPLFAVIEKEIFVVRESSERHRGVPSRVPS